MLTQSVACRGLFHTATGTAYADLLVDGHRETWPIRGKRFRGWLRRRYYEATGGTLGAQAISSELDLLEARAQFDAPERSIHVRVAEQAGRLYLDLADDHAVEIGPDGWHGIKLDMDKVLDDVRARKAKELVQEYATRGANRTPLRWSISSSPRPA